MKKIKKVFASPEMAFQTSRSANKKVQIYSFFPVDRGNCECHKTISKWKKKLALFSDNGRKEATQRQGSVVCPRSKNGMSRYKITCKNCNETMGYCWATDKTLTDWCDLHYVSWAEEHEIESDIEEKCPKCNGWGEVMNPKFNPEITNSIKQKLSCVKCKGKKKVKKKIKDHEHLWHGCYGSHISPVTEQLCFECTCGQDTRDFRANMTLPALKAFEIEEKNKVGREFGKSNSKFKASKVSDNVIPFKIGGK